MEENIKNNQSVEELYNLEISKSERLQSVILIGLLALEAVFLLVIYFFYSEEYLKMFNTHLSIYAILIFTAVIIIYESLTHYLMGKKCNYININPRYFRYINSFFEISLLSILLIFIVEYSNSVIILQSPATLTYFIFIILSTFRLNFKLSLFTGTLAALEYVFISIYYSTLYSNVPVDMLNPDLTGIQYLGQGSILIIAGVAAGFVANLIKKNMKVSWSSIKEKNEVIDLFGQQISSQIAENILENQNELSGTRKKVCVMFLDIRQFTPFVEKHEPEEVVAYLNTLFGFMIKIIESHHGVINQFLGDGFMATFGAPVSIGNSSRHATEASKEIIEKISEEFEKGNIPKTRIGIGLHYDEAVTGNIGSSTRKQYSITGKVVIMASRIEQLNKKYNTCLLISKEVYNHLNTDAQNVFDKIGSTKVKGSENPVSLYKYLKQ